MLRESSQAVVFGSVARWWNSKIAGARPGMLVSVGAAVGNWQFAPQMNVESARQISRAALEIEKMRQIGARVAEEDVV
jgi:hypothetical protein